VSRGTAIVLGGILAVVVGICVVGAVLITMDEGQDVQLLGDATFQDLDAESTAGTIEQIGPLLFSDVAGGDDDIIVQHLGDDPDEGWLAFAARPPGAERDCFAEWQPDDEVFEDTCTGDTYPPNGEGLEQYPAEVSDGKVVIDLQGERPTTTAA
jgi:hypothetical protein